MALQELKSYLAQLPVGVVDDDHQLTVVDLLSQSWELFEGSAETAMNRAKVTSGRLESLTWEPPILRFIIERHGATVNGSKSADLHEWHMDLDSCRASCSKGRSRRLQPFAARLDAKALANEIVSLITEGKRDERLTWKSGTCVKINMAIAITDSTAKQTTQGRRKRLRNALEPLLTAAGWHRKKSGTHVVFERLSSNIESE